MKKKLFLLSLLFLSSGILLFPQTYNGNSYRKKVAPTKNVIVMIPDGTSIGVVSAARLCQIYNKQGENLAIDPYFCGTVRTFSSNAPIGDSAPTTSAYMTGMPQQTGNVAIYPLVDEENDLVEVDAAMSYQPLVTVLEASRIEQSKATGLVVTCEFPHATPADCSSHHYQRGRYDLLTSQIAYQNLDVLFGGGVSLVTDDMKQHFTNKDITYYANDINAFREHKEGKVWSLWCDGALPYDLDRDATQIPSLHEMTEKALNLLSQNENGFFLMIEGSKIDWAAHANDAVGCITEYLAFDRAIQSVMEFAQKDGNTTVVILPDHGNSGFTTGRHDLSGYDRASITKLFGSVSKYKKTAEGLEGLLLKEHPENLKAIIKEYTGIDITDEELATLIESKNYKPENYMKVSDGKNMTAKLVEIMNKRTYFGFTTGGHTGEEVFLAAYHPQGDIPVGMNTNMEINHYLSDVVGLQKRLPELTREIFAKHTDVFSDCKYSFDGKAQFPVLTVKKGKNTLEIPAFKSVVYLNGKPHDIGSIVVYIDKTETFYLPQNLKKFLF